MAFEKFETIEQKGGKQIDLPRNLFSSKLNAVELPKNLFENIDNKILQETKELPKSTTEKIIFEVDSIIKEKISHFQDYKSKISFSDIEKEIPKTNLKTTYISCVYACSVLSALNALYPEKIIDEKQLKKLFNKFYKKNLKEITLNEQDTSYKTKVFSELETTENKIKSKAKELTNKTLETGKASIYVLGKLCLDASQATENGIKNGLEYTADKLNNDEFANRIKNINIIEPINEKYDLYFNPDQTIKDFVEKTEKIPVEVADLYLTTIKSEAYLGCKTVIGAGKIGENAGKFIGEIGAKALGNDELAKSIQQSHILDTLSDKIDDAFDVGKVMKTVGDYFEIAGEIGGEVGITILSLATGNVPLAVASITVSALDSGGKAVDLAVNKTGEFTWKETIFGLTSAVIDGCSKGLARGLTQTFMEGGKAATILAEHSVPYTNTIKGAALGFGESVLFQNQEIINPIMKKGLHIDESASVDAKKIAVITFVSTILGGSSGFITDKIEAKNLSEIVKELTPDEKLQDVVDKSNTYIETLSNEQKELLGSYTTRHHLTINSNARNNIPDKEVSELQNIIGKSEIAQDINVFRGASGRFGDTVVTLRNGKFKLPKEGSTITNGAFTSTSMKEKYASSYLGKADIPTLEEIILPKGSNGLYISDYAKGIYGPYQNEVLLNTNATRKVLESKILQPGTVLNDGSVIQQATAYIKTILI